MVYYGSLLLVVLLPLVLGILLDLLVGDPREGSRAERWYPPVLVGRLATVWDRSIRRGNPERERRAGAVLWASTVGLATLVALALVLLGAPAAATALAILLRESRERLTLGTAALACLYLAAATGWLSSCFTLSGLLRFCARPLGRSADDKRAEVGKVVNRPTQGLSEALLNSALIESAAENTTDSVVGPLLAYSLFGLPGAVAYRAVNTLDALLGHTDPRLRYVGETSAVVDRGVNLLPDRLTAWLLRWGSSPVSPVPDVRAAPGVKVPRSIVAAAQLAQVRLERQGSYVVGSALPLPTEDDVRRVLRAVRRTGAVVFVLSAIVAGGVVVAIACLVH